jgi:hypothetical protein
MRSSNSKKDLGFYKKKKKKNHFTEIKEIFLVKLKMFFIAIIFRRTKLSKNT